MPQPVDRVQITPSRAQRLDLGRVVAELFEHRVGILSELGRRAVGTSAPMRIGLASSLTRPIRMIEHLHAIALGEEGVLQRLADVVDRGARHAPPSTSSHSAVVLVESASSSTSVSWSDWRGAA